MWFDFHAECRGGRWDNLSSLLRAVSPALDRHGSFRAAAPDVPSESYDAERNDAGGGEGGGEGGRGGGGGSAASSWRVLNLQRGVVRTNCMDCLDRTNVVQGMFGRHALYAQLLKRGTGRIDDRTGSSERSAGRSKATTTTTTTTTMLPPQYVRAFRLRPLTLPWSDGEISHRHLWADNADHISRLYAGTPALKGDYTRTGRRTKRGALDDGVNSLTRYYLNNFLDADRQEGMDLLVGAEPFAALDGEGGGEPAPPYAGGGAYGEGPTGSVPPSDLRAVRGAMLGGSNAPAGGGKRGSPVSRPGERLDLLWLPGDLRDHMRGALSANADDAAVVAPVPSPLESIELRASSDRPWWSSEEDEENERDREDERSYATADAGEGRPSEGTTTSGGGHILGSLIAVARAPVATAASVLCLLLPGVLAASSVGGGDED